MLQRVTLGYFERDEGGRQHPRRREVTVDAESGEDAAAIALAEHGPALQRLSGYDPTQVNTRVAVLGVDVVPPEDRCQMSDDRGQMSDDRHQVSEVGQKAATIGKKNPKARSQRHPDAKRSLSSDI